MARKAGRTGSPTNLYLNDEVKRLGSELAFKEGKSLTELTNELLKKRIERAIKSGVIRGEAA
jgi:hypothetical protein